MKSLKTLVAMQLKDKIDIASFRNWKTALFKSIWFIIKFAVITSILYIAFNLLSVLRWVDLNGGIPDKFLLIIFTIMMILSILTCTIGLVKTLYYAKDNQLLLTMPTARINIFFSKLIVYYIYEVIRNITFIMPIFIAFGMVNGYLIEYYLWLIPSLLLFTGLNVTIGALLSIPAMLLSNLFRISKVLQYGFIIILISIGVYFIIKLINLIPDNLNIVETWSSTFWELQSFMDDFRSKFAIFAWVLEIFVGTRYVDTTHLMFYSRQIIYTLGALCAITLCLVVNYLIVRPIFYKIASSPFEYKKRNIVKATKNRAKNSFISAIFKELKLLARTPERFYTLIGLAVGMPIAILLLNKVYNAMDTRLTGTLMTVLFNIVMILLLALSSNTMMAKVYSEEGNSAYLMKTNPQTFLKSLVAKLVPNALIITISIVVTCLVYGKFGGQFVNTPLLIVGIELFYLAHLLWSAEMDLMNPQNAQYASTGTHTNNPNEVKSTLYMFLIAVIMGLFTNLVLVEGFTLYYIKFALIGGLFFILRAYLYVMKIKVYYREK